MARSRGGTGSRTRAGWAYGDRMTRQHFVAIADTIAALPPAARERELRIWIPKLRAENPRFDTRRFRAYVEKRAR